MEDVFDAAWREHPADDLQVDSELASLIDIRGLAVLDDPKLLRRLLLQACPDAQRHVGALVAAMAADVPKRLVAAKDDGTLPALLTTSALRLQDDAGLDAEWAIWAVRAWAHALALPTTGLAGPTTVGAAPAPVPSFASPIASAHPTHVDGLYAAGAGTIGGLWDRAPRTDTDPRPAQREPTMRDRTDIGARVEPVFAPPEPDVPRPEAEEPIAIEEPPLYLEPLFPEAAPEPAAAPMTAPMHSPMHASMASSMDSSMAAPPSDPDPMETGWIADARPDGPPGRSLAGPIVMMVVVLAVAGLAWFALEGMPGVLKPAPWSLAPTPRPTSRPTTAAPAADTATSTAARDVDPVPPVTAAASTPMADATVGARPSTAAAAPDVVPPESIASTSTAVSTPDPTPVATAAAPASHPTIVRVDVPSIVEGAPFTVALRLAPDARDVVSIERRVVDRSGAWPAMPTQFQASGLRRGSDGALLVPFRAMDAPSRAIVEFVAIARDGTRSSAKRASIVLDQPDPAVAALDIPVACTAATCGVVIESREIEPEVGTRGAIYQLSVRMDDRQVVTSTAPYRLQVGSRARLAGNRFVPADRRTP